MTMKQFLIGLCLLGLTSSTFAQNDLLFKKVLKREHVPKVILEAIDIDFPGYEIAELTGVPIEYVEDEAYIVSDFDSDDIETYEISLDGKDERIVATYNSDGKLISAIEKMENVTPPMAVSRALFTAFPGWTISKDAYHMSRFANGKEKERFRFMMTKDGMKKHIYTDGNGTILNGAKN